MVAWALLFDFADGFAARMLKVHSPIGEDLDSLADMVSFGALPGMMLYTLMKNALDMDEPGHGLLYAAFFLFVPFLITIFSALRLARFNVYAVKDGPFTGLPTPAAAMVVASLPPALFDDQNFLSTWVIQPEILGLFSIVLSLLLVSPLTLFSLKFKNFSLEENWYRYLLLLVSMILILMFSFSAPFFIIGAYLILSFLVKIQQNKTNSNFAS